MDLHEFFHGEDGVVRSLFKRRISRKQVEGCENIIEAFKKHAPHGTLQQLAYILATAYHETAYTMQPVRETLASTDEQAIRRLDSAFKRGLMRYVSTPYWREGYFGRGYVQLTHQSNYQGKLRDAVFRKFPGKDIGREPNLAMNPDISAFILIEGMMRGDTGVGDFTSKALEDYVSEHRVDYLNARRTVNPGDRSSYPKIAGEAEAFEEALKSANWSQ